MKKKLFLFALLVGMTGIAVAQKVDATINNGIGNIAMPSEFNFRDFSLDVCPIRIGNETTFLGFYGESRELYQKINISRSFSWNAGLSFNTKFGDEENAYLKLRLGLGQTRLRTETANSFYYKDWQRDFNFNTRLRFVFSIEEWQAFNRHAIDFNLTLPISGEKKMYSTNGIFSTKDSLFDNKIIELRFTETLFNFYLTSDEDWVMNFDIFGGYLQGNQFGKSNLELGAGISVYKVPYFQQNLFEILPTLYLGADKPVFVIQAKLNVIPLVFLIWDKFEIYIN